MTEEGCGKNANFDRELNPRLSKMQKLGKKNFMRTFSDLIRLEPETSSMQNENHPTVLSVTIKYSASYNKEDSTYPISSKICNITAKRYSKK